MKAVFFAVRGVLAFGTLYCVNPLWAQQQTPPPTPSTQAPHTRVALLNINYVVQNYTKCVNLMKNIKEDTKPFEDYEQRLRQEARELTKTPPPPDKVAEVQLKLKEIEHQIEDNRLKCKIVIGKKKYDDQMRILYMDMVRAAKGYADAHEFDVVLQYNDEVKPEDIYSTPNVARKMQSGAIMPLYFTPGVEISARVVDMLNYNSLPTAAQGASTNAAPPRSGQQ